MSFQYYDFILNFIDEYFPTERRDYFKTKTQIASELHVQKYRDNLLFKLGIFNKKDQVINLEDQIARNNNKELEFDYNTTRHVLALQKSDYICIEHDIMEKDKFQVNPQDKVEGKIPMKETSIGFMTKEKLNIHYCLHSFVKSENHEFLKFKAMFGQKQGHLKSKGQKIETQGRIHSYIEDNIDMFYKLSRRYFKKNMGQDMKRKIVL